MKKILLVAYSFLLAPLLWNSEASADPAPPQGDWEHLQNAGTDAIYKGQYGDGERLFKQAVIKGAVFGEADLRYAKSLGSLGRYYEMRGRFEDAEPLLEEELHVKEQAMDATEVIPSLGSMISFYLDHGTVSKADPLSEQLVAFVTGKLSTYRNDPNEKVTYHKGQPLTAWAGSTAATMVTPVIEWAITCDKIGDQYRLRGDYDMALKLYQAALDVKETVLGKQHLSLANSFDNLATIHMDKNEDQEAEQLYKDALDHSEKILPSDDPQVFSRVDKLAKCLIKEKKFDEAEKLLLRAQDFWKSEPPKGDSQVRAAYSLGSLYVEERKCDLAIPALQRALQLAETYYGPDSASLLPYLRRYADDMYYMGNQAERLLVKDRADTISGVDESTASHPSAYTQ